MWQFVELKICRNKHNTEAETGNIFLKCVFTLNYDRTIAAIIALFKILLPVLCIAAVV